MEYSDRVIEEWTRRGYRNNMRIFGVSGIAPWWLGDERLHSSHRGRLLYKDPDWYSQFGWSEEPIETGYWWPGREA